MAEKRRVLVEFEFDVEGTEKEIKECIGSQILTDLNKYWQNDDDTAQMTSIKITRIEKL